MENNDFIFIIEDSFCSEKEDPINILMKQVFDNVLFEIFSDNVYVEKGLFRIKPFSNIKLQITVEDASNKLYSAFTLYFEKTLGENADDFFKKFNHIKPFFTNLNHSEELHRLTISIAEKMINNPDMIISGHDLYMCIYSGIPCYTGNLNINSFLLLSQKYSELNEKKENYFHFYDKEYKIMLKTLILLSKFPKHALKLSKLFDHKKILKNTTSDSIATDFIDKNSLHTFKEFNLDKIDNDILINTFGVELLVALMSQLKKSSTIKNKLSVILNDYLTDEQKFTIVLNSFMTFNSKELSYSRNKYPGYFEKIKIEDIVERDYIIYELPNLIGKNNLLKKYAPKIKELLKEKDNNPHKYSQIFSNIYNIVSLIKLEEERHEISSNIDKNKNKINKAKRI